MPKKGNAPPVTPTCHPGRKHLARGLCKPCYDAQYGVKNRVRKSAKALEWQRNNPERAQAIRRKYLYGIEQEQFEAKFKAQGGVCKICLEGPAAHVDHDHAIGAVRGLLCGDCNRAIGLFRDDRDRLIRAAAYLDLHSDEPRGLLNHAIVQMALPAPIITGGTA